MSNPILDAAKLLNGQAGLAKAIGVRPPTVNQWVKKKRPISPEQGAAIELATKGQVTAEALCPDSNWSRIPDATWPHPSGRPVREVAREIVEA